MFSIRNIIFFLCNVLVLLKAAMFKIVKFTVIFITVNNLGSNYLLHILCLLKLTVEGLMLLRLFCSLIFFKLNSGIVFVCDITH